LTIFSTRTSNPLITALVSSLHRAEAFGRTLADLWIIIGADGQIGGRQRNVSPQLHVSGELTIPASGSEIEALALTWHREIQREIGIVRYERETEHT
jgi:hypothetical protein